LLFEGLSLSPELTAIVENAYREFACYRLRGAISVCRCAVCVGETAMHEVLAWLLTPEMRERLEDACLVEQDQAAAGLLSHAEGLVMGAIRKGVHDELRR